MRDSDAVRIAVRIPGGGITWTTVDREDLALALRRPLTLHSRGYAKQGRNYLHRLILGVASAPQTDHANRDKLDNRRANLRPASRSDNMANQGKLSTGPRTSRFRGVHRHSTVNSWIAQISRGGKMVHLGSFRTEIEAARAYDEAARRLHGAYAALNLERS